MLLISLHLPPSLPPPSPPRAAPLVDIYLIVVQFGVDFHNTVQWQLREREGERELEPAGKGGMITEISGFLPVHMGPFAYFVQTDLKKNTRVPFKNAALFIMAYKSN